MALYSVTFLVWTLRVDGPISVSLSHSYRYRIVGVVVGVICWRFGN